LTLKSLNVAIFGTEGVVVFLLYSLRIEIFVAIDFFHNVDHSSYSKNYASIIYFACYVLYYCGYFKFDLSFYTFEIIF
jgi:hypothetical protein